MLHTGNIRGVSARTPEVTSDPPQRQRGRIFVAWTDRRSWFSSYFCGEFGETVLQIRNGGLHRVRRCTSGNFFGGKRRFDGKTFGKIGFERWRNLLQIGERKFRPDFSLSLGFA